MIGKKLSDRRMALGLEIADVSRLSGMTPRQITAIERSEFQHFNSEQELARLQRQLDIPLPGFIVGRVMSLCLAV